LGSILVGEHRFADPQDFGERPGLKRTTARLMGRIAVSDFREMAQAGIVEMGPEGFDESQAGLLVRFARIPKPQ
jgi:hypothetical protein